jgi:predicted RNA-binding protein with PUA-like domain
MAHWLLKSEPGTWSWDQQTAAGTTEWDGVRNHQARNNLLAMRAGDRAFFYHSVNGTAVVGIVEVTAEAHPDTTDPTGRWVAVDVRAVHPLPRPVTLKAIKAEPRLADMVLVRQSRLSVQPVTDDQWRLICALGGLAPG